MKICGNLEAAWLYARAWSRFNDDILSFHFLSWTGIDYKVVAISSSCIVNVLSVTFMKGRFWFRLDCVDEIVNYEDYYYYKLLGVDNMEEDYYWFWLDALS